MGKRKLPRSEEKLKPRKTKILQRNLTKNFRERTVRRNKKQNYNGICKDPKDENRD